VNGKWYTGGFVISSVLTMTGATGLTNDDVTGSNAYETELKSVCVIVITSDDVTTLCFCGF